MFFRNKSRYLYLFLYLQVCLLNHSMVPTITKSFEEQFCQSFINCYDFSTQGKYAHEYHPALLSFTRDSLKKMESFFENKINTKNERLIIMGYEEHALPNFFPCIDDFKGGVINDEFTETKCSDWSSKIHNHFGIISAFLFRSLITNTDNHIFQSVSSDDFGQIFEPCMRFYHLYYFGNYLNIMLHYEKVLQPIIQQTDTKQLFYFLVKFWSDIYAFPVENSQSKIVITQDILFNIENARHLSETDYKVRKFFFGPDLTYPIETKDSCKKKATRNAQQFLQTFIKELKPIDNLPTVYIFKSFVDGVGKSTLLGNIKNYLKHSLDFESYQPVDNSSSVEYDFFEFAPSVFIADLPAQMSHFTFKPDGLVYVPIQTMKLNPSLEQTALEYFAKNNESLISNFKQLINKVQTLVSQQNFFAPIFCDQNYPEYLLTRNLIILKKLASNKWIPFTLDNHHFIGKFSENKFEIKILSPIGQARSEGLKNADPSQMLFYSGLTIPAAYDIFLTKLVQEFKTKKIANIVYVDFFSMYSRSSRENIRLNYLLQHTALQDQSFSIQDTLYDTYLSDADLLATLKNKNSQERFVNNITTETILRLFIHQFLQQNFDNKIMFASDKQLFEKIKDSLRINKSLTHNILKPYVTQKVCKEINILNHRYGLTKTFCNLCQLNWNEVLTLSTFLETYFSSSIQAPALKEYFSDFPDIINSNLIQQQEDSPYNFVINNNNQTFIIHNKIKIDSKNKILIKQIISKIRRNWYALVLNLLNATSSNSTDNCLTLSEIPFFTNFIVLRKDMHGYIYVLSKETQDPKIQPISKLSLSNYPHNTPKNATNFQFKKHTNTSLGLFGFCLLDESCFNSESFDYMNINLESEISFLVINHLKALSTHQEVLPINNLMKLLEESSYIQSVKKRFTKTAILNQDKHTLQKQDHKSRKYSFIKENQIASIRKLSQFIALLEIFVRDLDSMIYANKTVNDLTATANFCSEYLLPEYFGIIPKHKIDHFIDTKLIQSTFFEE